MNKTKILTILMKIPDAYDKQNEEIIIKALSEAYNLGFEDGKFFEYRYGFREKAPLSQMGQ